MVEEKKLTKKRALVTELAPALPDASSRHSRPEISVEEQTPLRMFMSSLTDMSPDEALMHLLMTLQVKLNSQALNGGFDKLSDKVDSVVLSQNEMKADVKDIKEALYDPSEGVFARVRDAKDDTAKNLSVLSTELIEVKKWKKNVVSVLLWIVGGVGTGLLALAGKVLWSYISGHLTFH